MKRLFCVLAAVFFLFTMSVPSFAEASTYVHTTHYTKKHHKKYHKRHKKHIKKHHRHYKAVRTVY